MEDAGCKQACCPGPRALDKMRQGADAAGSDNRNPHCRAGRMQQIQVEAPPSAVTIHAGQQDLAGAKGNDLLAPGNRVDPGWSPAAMGEDLPLPGAHFA